MKILSVVAALVLLGASPVNALAQMAGSNAPAGITVVATGTATVSQWVDELGMRYTPTIDTGKTAYGACSKAIDKLRQSMRDMGLADAVVETTVEYTSSMPGATAGPTALAKLRVAGEDVERVVAALEKDGWKTLAGGPRIVPRNEQAATDSADAAALAEARRRATAIAAADGRHIGRLLNVTPLPVDYFSSVLGSLASMATAMGRLTQTAAFPEVKQSAIFTFELLP
jgi:uncharacterized protein YggE